MRDDKGRFVKGHQGSRATQFKPGQHWRPRQPWWGKEWLETEYAEKSAGDIANEHGVTAGAILFWLHKHGIPRRTTSEARKLKHWGASGEDNPMFGMTGPLSSNWKGGRTPELLKLYNMPEWRALRSTMIERAEGKCVRCGAEDNLHVHCSNPDEGVDAHWHEEWLFVLCRSCHTWVHSNENAAGAYLEGGGSGAG